MGKTATISVRVDELDKQAAWDADVNISYTIIETSIINEENPF